MKTFLLASAVAAGLICSAGTADAQYRYRRSSNVYVAPAYGYATPSYYNSGVITTGYAAPSYYGSGIVTSGYTPAIYSPAYSVPYSYGSSYNSYNSGIYGSSYYGNSFYGNSSYGNYYGSGYRGYSGYSGRRW